MNFVRFLSFIISFFIEVKVKSIEQLVTFRNITVLATITKHDIPVRECFVVSSIVDVSMNKIALWITVGADD